MNTHSRRLQSDLYQLLLKSSKLEHSRSNVAESLVWHGRFVEPRQPGDNSFLWSLLRFRGDGVLHSIHHAYDFPEDAESELTQLLTTGDQHSFQVFVRRCGHRAPLTAGDIRTFNKIWRIPGWFWVTILKNTDKYTKSLAGTDPEHHAIMSTQARSTCINDNRLYVPEASSGSIKSAAIFLCQSDISRSRWSVDVMTSESDRLDLGLAESTPNVVLGEHGMLAWLANQAFQRRCTTERDFIFLCAEALLRPMVLRLHENQALLHAFTSEEHINTNNVSDSWSNGMMNLVACQDAIGALPGWVDDLCLEAASNDQIETRASILRQYDQKLKSQGRAMNTFKHKLDLAFSKTGEGVGLESINETKFSKILAIIAVVYLPISIASSFFGMNVQELNGQGVSIVWFIVAIFAALGTLVLCWLFFAFVTSQRDAIKDTWKDKLRKESFAIEPRPWILRFWFVGMTRGRIGFWPSRMHQTFIESKDKMLVWIRTKLQVTDE